MSVSGCFNCIKNSSCEAYESASSSIAQDWSYCTDPKNRSTVAVGALTVAAGVTLGFAGVAASAAAVASYKLIAGAGVIVLGLSATTLTNKAASIHYEDEASRKQTIITEQRREINKLKIRLKTE